MGKRIPNFISKPIIKTNKNGQLEEKQAWMISLEQDQVPETEYGLMEAAETSTALLEWDELHVLCSGKSMPSKTPYF